MALTAISNVLAAQSVEWVARTNGGIAKAHAVPTAIATDKSGNIYVVGFVMAGIASDDGFNTGFLTVAYDRLGNELWARARKANRKHTASAVAVGADGHVYVAGSSYNGTDDDFFTVAYDSAGNELWARLKNGVGNGDDHALAVALDGRGRIYVAGSSYNGTDDDFFIVQYDSSGKELWARSKSGPAGKDTLAALAVSAGGAAYVTGFSDTLDHTEKFLTVAYDSAGNELWSRVESGEGNRYDRASALAVDSGGNVYVAGSAKTARRDSVYIFYDSDYLTVKYDRDGHRLWSRLRAGEADRYDEVSALAVDAEGNAYVTGSSFKDLRTAGGCINCERYLTVAYDSAGTELWARTNDDAGKQLDYRAIAVGIDPNGAVVVTGNVVFRGDSRDIRASLNDYLTVKYDSGGNQLWSTIKDGARKGWKSSDAATALAIDGDGHVVVAGAAVLGVGLDTGSDGADENPADFLTISYDNLGAELWTKRATTLAGSDDRPGHCGESGGMAIAAHANGTVFVTGSSRKGQEVVDYDYLTAAYDGDGNQLWVRRKDGPAGRNDLACALALDASGKVAVTGATWSTVSSSDRSIVSKSDWSIRSSEYMTVVYDRAGLELWSRTKHGPADRDNRATGVAFDGTGRVFVTGTSSMTVAYDSGGHELWTRIKDRGDQARAIAVDGNGNVYVAGSSYNGKNDDFLTVAYDSAGQELWAKVEDSLYGEAFAVAADGSSHVYVTGRSIEPSALSLDYLTVAYDIAGKELWSRSYDGGGTDTSCAVAAVGATGAVVTGHSEGQGADYLTIRYETAVDTTLPSAEVSP